MYASSPIHVCRGVSRWVKLTVKQSIRITVLYMSNVPLTKLLVIPPDAQVLLGAGQTSLGTEAPVGLPAHSLARLLARPIFRENDVSEFLLPPPRLPFLLQLSLAMGQGDRGGDPVVVAAAAAAAGRALAADGVDVDAGAEPLLVSAHLGDLVLAALAAALLAPQALAAALALLALADASVDSASRDRVAVLRVPGEG